VVWLGVFAALIPLLALLASIGILWAVSETVGLQLVVALVLVLALLVVGYALLFRALRGRGATGLAIGISLLVLLAFVIEVAVAMPLILGEFPAVYLAVPAVVLAALAVVLSRPAARERLARTILGSGPDETPPARP
jgi:hypothetical protein